MKHRFTIGFTSMLVAASIVAPAFAQSSQGSVSSKAKGNPPNAACMATAASTRDSAIATAFATYGQTVSTAMTKRGQDITAAWTNDTNNKQQLKKDLQAAYSNFRTAKQAAYKTLTSARQSAWSTWKTAEKSCHVTDPVTPASSSDAM